MSTTETIPAPHPDPRAVWDASDCALVLIDYQENVLDLIFEQDRRVIELNALSLAKTALAFDIPVVLSTVGVEMKVDGPTIPSLKAALPDVTEIDRSSMNAWDDAAFVQAVKATGRKRLVMAGIVTSTCLAFPAVDAIANGFEVMFVEDAVGDRFKHLHDTAVLRMVQAGAIPNSALSIISEWFRDWKSTRADFARELYVPYLEQIAALKRDPEFHRPRGLKFPVAT
ncbi:hydrolase [Sphingomonas daechungensis]|jgi:nicotinamidase-related amidase|uniref:isochorismatase family protein n=1 Tax=Sphingomonas daechungensis TaxID=1176646 RepID=UPI0031E65226